jgi:hypothetical protein
MGHSGDKIGHYAGRMVILMVTEPFSWYNRPICRYNGPFSGTVGHFFGIMGHFSGTIDKFYGTMGHFACLWAIVCWNNGPLRSYNG